MVPAASASAASRAAAGLNASRRHPDVDLSRRWTRWIDAASGKVDRALLATVSSGSSVPPAPPAATVRRRRPPSPADRTSNLWQGREGGLATTARSAVRWRTVRGGGGAGGGASLPGTAPARRREQPREASSGGPMGCGIWKNIDVYIY